MSFPLEMQCIGSWSVKCSNVITVHCTDQVSKYLHNTFKMITWWWDTWYILISASKDYCTSAYCSTNPVICKQEFDEVLLCSPILKGAFPSRFYHLL